MTTMRRLLAAVAVAASLLAEPALAVATEIPPAAHQQQADADVGVDVGTLIAQGTSQQRDGLIDDADRTAEQIREASPAVGEAVSSLLARWRAAASETIHDAVPADLPASGHVFVLLGYHLHDDGQARDELLGRLETAAAGLEAYPASRILVSGGVAQGGVTEAEAMRSWLLEHGIAGERIFVEDRSDDTPTNALFSMAILRETSDVSSYTLVTSASHMRRAVVLFEAAGLAAGTQPATGHAVAPAGHLAYRHTLDGGRTPDRSERALTARNVAWVWDVEKEYTDYRATLRGSTAEVILGHARGDDRAERRGLTAIADTAPEFADRIAELLERWDSALATEPHSVIPETLPDGHAFVVPSASLRDDGSLTDSALQRLDAALEAVAAHPGSAVAVVGGGGNGGITPAAAQQAWLLDRGVSPDRIIAVDTSSSFAQGARQTLRALGERAITAYTVITDASRLRHDLAVYAAGATHAAAHNGTGVAADSVGRIAADVPSDDAPVAEVSSAPSDIAEALGVLAQFDDLLAAPSDEQVALPRGAAPRPDVSEASEPPPALLIGLVAASITAHAARRRRRLDALRHRRTAGRQTAADVPGDDTRRP